MMSDVIFEIGLEELPARFIDNAEKELHDKTSKWLKKERITFEEIETFSTPRRLAILIKGIRDTQETVTEKVRGPQIKIAKDEKGNWTKAAIGFTKGQGKTTDDIYIEEIKGVSYICVEKRMEGKKTIEVLPDFEKIVADINFPQTMRWGNQSYRFARPIRWLVALMDGEVIPFEIAGVKTANRTFGHRFLGKEIMITQPREYEQVLAENYVIARADKRELLIKEQIRKLEDETDFHIEINPSLLQEVRNLVEFPTVFYGRFEEEYLALPEEVLVTSMQEHQRYFPVMTKDQQKLLPYFISVRNGDSEQIENVVRGNEKVLRARLADAAFFYDEDKKYSVDYYQEKLKSVVFQEKIGTIYEKTENVKQITAEICSLIKCNNETTSHAIRAAEICKFDLMTNMVNEFPELQGTIGEKYASHFGENTAVATAVREHYLPLQANGKLPETEVGAIVSVADKLDTIVGSISVGLTPTGSQDPYGLRRQTIGVLRILLEQQWDVTVEQLVNIAKKSYHSTQYEEQLQEFFTNRAAYLLHEQGIEQDVVRAVLDEEIGVFTYTLQKANLLSQKRNDPAFKEAQEAFVRMINVTQKYDGKTQVDPIKFQTDSEKKLYEQYEIIQAAFQKYEQAYEAELTLLELEKLTKYIHAFFEYNMVMDEDENVRKNRLALVSQIATLIQRYANMTLIEWKQHM